MILVWLNQNDKQWYTTEAANIQLLDLFGTDTLPLPFAEATPLETVFATLRCKNPGQHFQFSRERPATKNIFDPKHYATKDELLKVCILHVLKDGGQFSFDLHKKVQALVEGLTPGALEPVLKKLLLGQLVSRTQKQVRFNGSLVSFYELTRWGEQHLKDKLREEQQ